MLAGLALGENLSGVVASVVSWLGLSPRLSFCVLAAIVSLSAVAFHRLDYWSGNPATEVEPVARQPVAKQPLNPGAPFMVVGLTSLFENAVLPSVLPYATARYSQGAYHIASTIPAGPLVVFTLRFCQAPQPVVLAMTAGITCLVIVIVSVGLGRIDPGGAAIITLVMIAKAGLAYCKAASMYHIKASAYKLEEAQKHLESAGATMQLWSFFGSLAMFWLVHYSGIFSRSSSAA